MKRDDFLNSFGQSAISPELISKIEKTYGCNLTKELQKMLSFCENGLFLEGERFCRLLSAAEILNASSELHIDFLKQEIMPIFDMGENNFVVFDFKKTCWKKFNIVDEIAYGERKSLAEII